MTKAPEHKGEMISLLALWVTGYRTRSRMLSSVRRLQQSFETVTKLVRSKMGYVVRGRVRNFFIHRS